MEKLRQLYRKDKTAMAFDWHCLCVKFGQSRHRPFITGKMAQISEINLAGGDSFIKPGPKILPECIN